MQCILCYTGSQRTYWNPWNMNTYTCLSSFGLKVQQTNVVILNNYRILGDTRYTLCASESLTLNVMYRHLFYPYMDVDFVSAALEDCPNSIDKNRF